jgi:hypothetical protein
MFLAGYVVGQHMERQNLVKAGYGEFNNGKFELKTPAEIIRNHAAERAAEFINEISETE